ASILLGSSARARVVSVTCAGTTAGRTAGCAEPLAGTAAGPIKSRDAVFGSRAEGLAAGANAAISLISLRVLRYRRLSRLYSDPRYLRRSLDFKAFGLQFGAAHTPANPTSR